MQCGGTVIAAGRASEIVDLGDGTVLRRFLTRGDATAEAAVMGLARSHGFPVPAVHEVRSDGLVLDRIDGVTMAAEAARRPWRLPAHARLLADLHDKLHRIPVAGGVLLHLDLHPRNVMMSARGPVVIDWANAAPGEAALDPALTWVILMTSAGPRGRVLAQLFSRRIDVRSRLLSAVARRLRDRNLTTAERERVQRLLE